MEKNGITPADCPERTVAEAYRCVALASAGRFDEALKAAKALAKVPADPERAGTPGTRMLLWEAKTLPARLLLARRKKGDARAGLETLPKPKDPQLLSDKSDASYYYQGLVAVLEGEKAVEAGKTDRARQILGALAAHGEQMAKRQGQVALRGELSEWGRAIEALQIYGSALRGDIVMAGPKSGRGSAYNWYLAAADRQHPAAMAMPPSILEPMRVRVADYLRSAGKKEKAIGVYQEVLLEWPGNLRALEGLKTLGVKGS
jgi:tetratricopeptide (TPR) repeat protein